MAIEAFGCSQLDLRKVQYFSKAKGIVSERDECKYIKWIISTGRLKVFAQSLSLSRDVLQTALSLSQIV